MTSSDEVESRFAAETAEVHDPEGAYPGEVIPPPKPEPAPEFAIETYITEEMVGAILSIPGAMMARKTGHDAIWLVTEDEKELLGKGATPVIHFLIRKWLTDTTSPYAALVAVLAVVYGPRAVEEVSEQRRQKKNPSQPSRFQPNPARPSPRQSPQPSRSESAPSSGSEDAASPPSSSPSLGELID